MLTPAVLDEFARLRADGPRRFADWNPTAFDEVAVGPAVTLTRTLDGEPDADAVVAGYLRLAQEAVGTGAVTSGDPATGRYASVLAALVVDVLPTKLAQSRESRRLPVLVEAWNIGDGLRRGSAWLDRYLTACLGNLADLDDLPGFVARTLGPVTAPSEPATWTGDLRVTVLDLRAAHDEFVPGRVRVAAPTLLAVEDRRRAGLQVGVLLRNRGACELLGVFSGLEVYPEPGPKPVVRFDDQSATVGVRNVTVPTLRECHSFAVARAGFVAAVAVDSQRLWVIESD